MLKTLMSRLPHKTHTISNDARVRRVLDEIENSPGADILTLAFAEHLAVLTEGVEVDLDEIIEGDVSLRSEVQQ